MRTNHILLTSLLLWYSALTFGQPTIDGIFDGTTTWGNPIAISDGQLGWGGANIDQLYTTYDSEYLYLGYTNIQASDWQSFGIIINTTDNIGNNQEVWGYPITYGHNELPDIVVKGHFGQGGTPYAELYIISNGQWQRTDNLGNDSALATVDFACEETGMIEVRIKLSIIGQPSTGDIQAYITGNVQTEHATFDAIPDDEVATSWNDNTTLDQYATDIDLGGSPAVTLTPSFPKDTEAVNINFDATGTSLAGSSGIYLHAGVALQRQDLKGFDQVVGNWGVDDGIGQMNMTSSDQWEITLGANLLDYFSLDTNTDIFQLNFLFRNTAGDIVEDATGTNYGFAIDPGFFVEVITPTLSPQYVEVGLDYSLTVESDSLASNWSIDIIDNMGTIISNVATATNIGSITTIVNDASAGLIRYRVTASFPNETKTKVFEIMRYASVVDSPRPSWTVPGINYHSDDPTKATLVLHAPVHTRYYKYPSGQQLEVGTNATSAKNVVHVLGDFNNWTGGTSYQLKRDKDGWNEASQTDGDNDGDRGHYWWIELSGLTPGEPYVFQYLVDGELYIGDPYTEQVSDSEDQFISPERYTDLLTYPSEAKGRASVLQTAADTYSWTASSFTAPDINDLNIYELHFRDFTEEGTYRAAIERLSYLEALGINTIHVMPVSEFEGNSSWGYNPNFYFAADKYYGPANELKAFIDECHKREILVVNDLVLNHAFYSNSMAQLYWNTIDNKPANDNPWFNPEHKMVSEPAGWWGADWNHESEHTQVMVDRALDYWLQEFKFDGFRFDFTKGIGQSAQDPGDPWASSYDQDRIDLLFRMVNGMKARNPGAIAIFEHLANSSEDAVLADAGILMWSGAGHHSDIKEFMLGYNGQDIYNSGIHTAKGFAFANWMSYMESHDEERQAYEIMQYGNGNTTYTTEDVVDRLKIGAVFNLLFPGPRMVWQFEELAYDESINLNGRTGAKPMHWEYYFDEHRQELWRLMAMIFHLRDEYNLYNVSPDYGNIGASDAVTVPRYMKLNDGAGHYVISIANLDPANSQTVTPGYDVTGTWYRYNGDPTIDGTTYSVSNTTDTYTLGPSESLIITNFDIGWTDLCNAPDACCVRSIFTWTGGVGNWNSATNWDLQTIPRPCDMVIIPPAGQVTIPVGETGYAREVWIQTGGTLDVLGEIILKDE